jgi:adenosylmethionine-8-amino-7-oxononanoate aminotransferase
MQRNLGALSANGVTEFREAFEPLVPGFRHIPDLVENAREVGQYLGEKLKTLLDLAIVANISGKGLLRSVELKNKATGKEIPYPTGVKIRERTYELGLICRFQINSLVMTPL